MRKLNQKNVVERKLHQRKLISGSSDDEYDIITLQYTEEGLLSVDDNREGRAAAFGDDIAIVCLATEFKREIFVAVAMVKRTPAYKNRLKALELERSGGITNKKKGQRNMGKKVEEDLSNELDLQISGTERPSVWTLVGVRFVLLPYTLGKLLLWSGCWFWRYKVKKYPYSWEDACYLTQSSLGAPDERWRSIDEGKKEDLVLRRLWEKSNMETYMTEMRKESKRRR